MLPKSERIPRQLFAILLKKGFSANSPLFSAKIIILDKGYSTNNHLSVVTSKKVAAKANIRNRLRRVSYSVFEVENKKNKTTNGFAAAVFIKKTAVSLPIKKFRSELSDFLRRIENLCKKR